MKPFDLFLLSVAIGLTTFTVHVLGAGDPAAAVLAAPRPAPARNPAFRMIVLHHSATHGGNAAAFERDHRARLGGLAYHFVIGNGSGSPDGVVETGYRWEDRIPGPHTKSDRANAASVAICLVGNFEKEPPTRKQIASLLELIERVSGECGIPPEAVYSHREVDPETACPGRGLPMNELRGLLKKRRVATGAPRRATGLRSGASGA